MFGIENKANYFIHSNLAKIKNKILPTSLQGNYRDSLGEFSSTSCGVFEARFPFSQIFRFEIPNETAFPVGGRAAV